MPLRDSVVGGDGLWRLAVSWRGGLMVRCCVSLRQCDCVKECWCGGVVVRGVRFDDVRPSPYESSHITERLGRQGSRLLSAC